MVKPSIVTFYSFRGGVGRSMAMLNVGCLLAQSRRRVLLVDFDLEAPGLTHLIDRQEMLKTKSQGTRAKGLVDILHSYLSSPASSILNAKSTGRRLSTFLVELDVPQANEHYGKGGSLHLMPAGGKRHYEKRLDELYMSSREFKEVRKAFAKRFRRLLLDSGRFDYIFVDARTGFSDEGYIAAKFLCDHLIVLSGLNDQNIKGTAEFLTKLAAWKREKHGPDRILLVASPVCEYEDDPKQVRYREARRILKEVTGADMEFTLSLPYHPMLALYEEVIALRWPNSGLGRAYRHLEYIIRYVNEDAASHWARRAQEATERLNADAFAEAIENIAAIDREQAVGLARQTSASLARLAGDEGRKALPILESSARIDPDEPLHPLQAAHVARNAGLASKEVLKRLDRATQLASKQNNLPAMVAILYERANALMDSDHAGARDATLEAFKISERLGTQETSIDALLLAARAEEGLGDYSAAVAHAERALSIARKLSQQAGISFALRWLAQLRTSKGDYAAARNACQELLKTARKLGDREGVVTALSGIARLDDLQGNRTAARKRYEECLAIARERADRAGMARAFRALGHLDLKEGSFVRARERFQKVLEIYRELADGEGTAHVLQSIALWDRYQGNYVAARKRCKDSLKIFRELHNRRGISVVLQTIADLDRLQGKCTAARKVYEESLKIAREMGDPRSTAVMLHAAGEFERSTGHYTQALKAFDEALKIHEKTGFADELLLLMARAEAVHVQLNNERPLRKLRSLVKRAEHDPDLYTGARSILLLGSIELERGDFKKALVNLEKACDKAQRYGMRDIVAFSQAEQALCLSKVGQAKEAAQAAKAALAFFKEQHVRHPKAAKLRKFAGAATKSQWKRETKKTKSQ